MWCNGWSPFRTCSSLHTSYQSIHFHCSCQAAQSLASAYQYRQKSHEKADPRRRSWGKDIEETPSSCMVSHIALTQYLTNSSSDTAIQVPLSLFENVTLFLPMISTTLTDPEWIFSSHHALCTSHRTLLYVNDEFRPEHYFFLAHDIDYPFGPGVDLFLSPCSSNISQDPFVR